MASYNATKNPSLHTDASWPEQEKNTSSRAASTDILWEQAFQVGARAEGGRSCELIHAFWFVLQVEAHDWWYFFLSATLFRLWRPFTPVHAPLRGVGWEHLAEFRDGLHSAGEFPVLGTMGTGFRADSGMVEP